MAPDATVRPRNGLFLPDNVGKFTNIDGNINSIGSIGSIGASSSSGGCGSGDPHKLDRRHTFPNSNVSPQQLLLQQPRQQPQEMENLELFDDRQWFERFMNDQCTPADLEQAFTLCNKSPEEIVGTGDGSVCPSAIFPKDNLTFHGGGGSGIATKPYVFPGAEPEPTLPDQTNGVVPMVVDPPTQNRTITTTNTTTPMGPPPFPGVGDNNANTNTTQKAKASENGRNNGESKAGPSTGDGNKTSPEQEPEPVQQTPQYKLAEEGSELVIKAVANYLDRSGYANHPSWWDSYVEWCEFYNEWKAVREPTFKFWDNEIFHEIFWLASQLEKHYRNGNGSGARYQALTKWDWNETGIDIIIRDMFRDLIFDPIGWNRQQGGGQQQSSQQQQQSQPERHSLPSSGLIDLSSDYSLFGNDFQQQQQPQQMRHSL